MKQQNLRDYVHSSQLKRENFTLKNMLSAQLDQCNYRSQHSTRIPTGRPHTMYGDRVRNLLYDENKKNKMHTQIKIKRQMSSHVIGKSNSNKVITKTVTTDEKIKLKKCLGKINILSEGYNNMELDQQIQAIFDFLKCLTQIDNHYTQAFCYITQKLQQLVYANPQNPKMSVLKKLAQETKNEVLISFFYRPIKKITFNELSSHLVNITSTSIHELEDNKDQNKEKSANYEQEIEEKLQIINKLKKQLKYYQENPSQDIFPHVQKLESENDKIKSDYQQLLQIKKENQFDLQIHQNTNTLLSEQVQTLKNKIYEHDMQQLSGMKSVQKNSQIKQFQDHVSTLKAMLDKSKLKMQGMKEEYDKVRQYNEELINERSQLAKRAAVGFGELTPRPNVKGIFKQKNLKYEQFVALSEKNTTTQNIMVEVIDKLRFVNMKQKVKKAEKKRQIVKKDSMDFVEQVMDSISQAKKQIHKTQNASQDVKKSYNKQKAQRQELQSKMN